MFPEMTNWTALLIVLGLGLPIWDSFRRLHNRLSRMEERLLKEIRGEKEE